MTINIPSSPRPYITAFAVAWLSVITYVVVKGWNSRTIFYKLRKRGVVCQPVRLRPVSYADQLKAYATMESSDRPHTVTCANSEELSIKCPSKLSDCWTLKKFYGVRLGFLSRLVSSLLQPWSISPGTHRSWNTQASNSSMSFYFRYILFNYIQMAIQPSILGRLLSIDGYPSMSNIRSRQTQSPR